MARVILERELQQLQDQILMLGSEVEEHLTEAVDALRQRNMTRSRQLIKADTRINEKRIKIGMECLTVIATQQPTAGDMRQLAAMIEIAGELERIHDYVKGISKINLLIGENSLPRTIIEVMPEMTEQTRDMLRRALDAFAKRDATQAKAIPEEDDIVDDFYNKAYREMIVYASENPEDLEKAQRLEWAAHNIERTADRVTNICEWVIYMVTGKYAELDRKVAPLATL